MKPYEGLIEDFFAGDGLFETLLMQDGNIAFAAGHLARLRSSASELGFPPPPPDLEVLAAIEAHLASTGLAGRTLRMNLRLDRDELTLLTREIDPALIRARASGVAAITVQLAQDRRGRARHKWVERKTLRAAMQRAREVGAGEAILIAPDGCLLEGATSNVFCAAGGRLRTPPTDTRILPGVTRSAIQELATGLGLDVDESAIAEDTLRVADEVFLTSAVRMLVPVVTLDDQPVNDGLVGPLARRLAPLLWQRAFGTDD